MKFDRSFRFDRDLRRLSIPELRLFRTVVREQFSPACDRYASDPSTRWPASLRIKSVQNHPGVLEMTWSFAGPDGRATFEFVTVEGELRVRWRRVGGHDIFREP